MKRALSTLVLIFAFGSFFPVVAQEALMIEEVVRPSSDSLVAAKYMAIWELMMVSYEMDLAVSEAEAEARERKADAKEAHLLANIAWSVVGEGASENNSDLRESITFDRKMAESNRNIAASRREMIPLVQDKFSEFREMSVTEQALKIKENPEYFTEQYELLREGVLLTRAVAADTREEALEAKANAAIAEGNMMKAQASVTGQYAVLWDRAAKEQGIERTAWIRAAAALDKLAEIQEEGAEIDARMRDAYYQAASVVGTTLSGSETLNNWREHMTADEWINDPVDQVQMLVDQKVDIGKVYVDNIYPVLYFLVRQEEPNLTAIRMLLDAGADPEKRFGERTSPLKTAVADDKQTVAFLLIAYGADPNREQLSSGIESPCKTIGIDPEFRAAMGCSQVQDQ